MTATFDRLAQALAGQYRVEKEIGAGGMATVYLAEDLKHHRRVAVKVLRPDLAAALGATRFTQEIEIAARLQHPHILPVHDSGEADGFLYYVMPYVEGESLRERLSHRGEFPIHEAVRLLVEVADALAYAHAHHVVHRDIKPENIMISGRHALVMDFGVAKAVSEASGRNKLTTAGVALGTPAYMAPEQASADPNLDQRVDIYALGVLGYELLSGQPPFTGGTPQQVLAAHITIAPEPVTTRRPSVSAPLASVIMRALEKRPADRWQTAEEMLTQLEPLATPSGGMTPSQTRPVQGITIGRRMVPRWLAVGAALFVIATALGWSFIRGHQVTRIVEPDRTQVTFTGNATSPALSPDGTRLAYTTRQCTAEGYCTFDLVVQDVGGAGVSTVLHGWASIETSQWSDDARFLLVSGFEGQTGRWGPFSVPSLGGGTPRWLGCCTARIGIGDTALVYRNISGDSLRWVLRVPLADGVPRDNFSFRHQVGSNTSVQQLDSGDRLLLVRYAGGIGYLTTVERDGHLIDSVQIDLPRMRWSGAETVRGGRDLVVGQDREEGLGDFNLLRFPIDAKGRISTRPDTVMSGLRGWFSTEPNGMLAQATATPAYEIWSMTRAGASGMAFTQRRLAAATAPLGGAIDPSGRRFVLGRRVVVGGKALLQLAVIPADSGAETPLGAPRDIADYRWTEDGRALVLAMMNGDTAVISEQEVPSGRSRVITALPSRDFFRLATLAGGGVVIATTSGRTLLIRGVAGRPDAQYTLPDSEGVIRRFDTSPDGKAVVISGWDRNYDSIVVRRIDLASLQATKLWAAYADGDQGPAWLQDGTIVEAINENAATQVWYRIPAAGGHAVRLGTPPRGADARFGLSRDGRHLIALAVLNAQDIYLVRNFRDLLGN